jgi:hypothetical protein
MLRTFIRLAILTIGVTFPALSARAAVVALQGETNGNQGTLDFDYNYAAAYPAQITVNAGASSTVVFSGAALQPGWGNALSMQGTYLNFSTAWNNYPYTGTNGPTYCLVTNGLFTNGLGYYAPPPVGIGQRPMPTWRPAPPLRCPPGKFFYVVEEGAGLGDRVRRLPCTGREKVSDAIGQIGGLSQISGTKMWIARPSPTDRDKGTILAVNWEDISRHNDDATNYPLLPGDRLVVQGDASHERNNSVSMKAAGTERVMGIASLIASTVHGIRATPGGVAAVKQLVQTSLFDDDPQVKRIVEETIRVCEEEGKKAAAKPAETPKPGQ